MVIDGKKIAEEIISALEKERGDFGALSLAVVSEGEDAATESFIKIKSRVAARLGVEVRRYTPAQISEALECDGVIVQLPIPNAAELLAVIPPEKDVDGIGTMSESHVLPPVMGAIAEIFTQNNVDVQNKKVLIVGHGNLVGKPAENWFKKQGVTPTVVTNSEDLKQYAADADIVVLGTGTPGLVTPDMLKTGVVLIDAGTSEQGGKLAGDATSECAEIASIFTPVPGGIGPIAVAMIFKNLFVLNSGKVRPR
ncbi:bifunctional 5,10-methylenetetrahydrofolate dehydrogenase/5,10-methenyltetrahydrofolate cyclohydrolase [Patescibacteria group bacterium]|nr:bifunctional 5,10-methylenetetrahydrofolate dehydrogenase/5,10-methenyltetrahydrofolate cyclohydrolase [Patescibacteria group bacterium]